MTGYLNCIRHLEQLRTDVTAGSGGKIDAALDRMARGTRLSAESLYDQVKENPDYQASDIEVGYSIDGDTATISATGEQILFVEFGTGINNNYDSASMVAGEYGFSPASWSMQNSQWLLPPKSIYFKGWWPAYIERREVGEDGKERNIWHWTEGHPPVDAMYHAFQELRREHFKKAIEENF